MASDCGPVPAANQTAVDDERKTEGATVADGRRRRKMLRTGMPLREPTSKVDHEDYSSQVR